MAMMQDPDLEQDPRVAAAYHAGSREEPPAHLDAVIRAAARREVGAGPSRSGTARIRNWSVPLSLAAVVVLSVTLVLMMQEEGMDRRELLTSPLPERIAPRDPMLSAERAVEPLQKARESPPADPTAAPRVAAALPAPAGFAAEPGPLAEARPRAAETGQRMDAKSARAKIATADVANAEEDAGARRERVQPAPPPASVRPQLHPAPTSAIGEMTAGAGPAAQSAKPAAAMADVPAKSVLWRDLIHEPPAKWIQRIAELRRAGKSADGDALVAEFRRRFPDERLPDELR